MKKVFTVFLYVIIVLYAIYPLFHLWAWGYEWNEFFSDLLRSATVIIISAAVLYFSSHPEE